MFERERGAPAEVDVWRPVLGGRAPRASGTETTGERHPLDQGASLLIMNAAAARRRCNPDVCVRHRRRSYRGLLEATKDSHAAREGKPKGWPRPASPH